MKNVNNAQMSRLISIVTTPYVLSRKAVSSVGETIIEMGKASEEVFRGDRLPILRVPLENTDDRSWRVEIKY
ncbi:MAG: hypothetical protein DSM107014_12335 [Gomphosphaeria aponina SAG 52.96 = DSM 107014]|uniref:Uncharacterized protein n=1 Tax=Gomphosphaeria aponina SAG 52.96 = DSM 107014 TaxID=1521640 RepID=A0A941GX69_9CHRO|nr:hypothetical protein [Gomphosphaeria aponina SAG 52.96 = DSM 107014]